MCFIEHSLHGILIEVTPEEKCSFSSLVNIRNNECSGSLLPGVSQSFFIYYTLYIVKGLPRWHACKGIHLTCDARRGNIMGSHP